MRSSACDTLSRLESLAQLHLPVKVFVFNNGALGFVELEQKATDFISTGTELKNPDFAAMAEAVDVRGIRLEMPEDVEAGIAPALAHDGPTALCLGEPHRAWRCRPRLEMAKGFTLYMVKWPRNWRGASPRTCPIIWDDVVDRQHPLQPLARGRDRGRRFVELRAGRQQRCWP
jgi:hypothetical protein